MFKRSVFSTILISVFAGMFLILLMALVNLQIIKGRLYYHISQRNFVRIKTVPSVRGEIFDSNYKPIVLNVPSFNLYIKPGEIKDSKKVAEFVAQHYGVELEEVNRIIHDNRFRLYHDVLLVENIPYEQRVKTAEMLNYFPSLSFRNETIRQYQYPNHFSGYVGKINSEELKTYGDKYTLNSRIGKTGLERYYEAMLVGTAGYEVLQVDASGKNLDFFRHNLHKEPQHGATLILSLDNRLQQFISDTFPENMRGSVVVMDVKTGGILAYVSKPDFDPNMFVTGISVKDWNALMNDKSKPMLDRIIHGTYPPGSVYKPVTGSLGLEMQVIDSTTELAECVGGMQVGNRFFKCWNHQGHGFVNITEALKYSCDVFFYDLSTNFTLKQMNDYTKESYITIPTGVDLVGERRGFFPTQQWYEDNYGKHISILGQKINMSIGQGELLVTPLQMCAYFNALAHHGQWIRPHFLHKVITPEGSREYHADSKPLPLHPQNLALMQDALYQTVNGYRGTGAGAKLPDVAVYGKTGSAENHMGEETHAWFCGYAAWEEPEISFTVFVENAGGGGSVAAPIAREIVSYYHTLKQEKAE